MFLESNLVNISIPLHHHPGHHHDHGHHDHHSSGGPPPAPAFAPPAPLGYNPTGTGSDSYSSPGSVDSYDAPVAPNAYDEPFTNFVQVDIQSRPAVS